MEPFVTFIQTIDEASVTRLINKMDNQAIAIISAWRGCRTKTENRKRNVALAKDIRALGYQYYTVKGRFIENFKTQNERNVDEDSMVVFDVKPSKESDAKLKTDIMALGYKYNQDAILYKDAAGDGWTIRTQDVDRDCNIGQPITIPAIERAGKVTLGSKSMFQSVMKGKEITFK